MFAMRTVRRLKNNLANTLPVTKMIGMPMSFIYTNRLPFLNSAIHFALIRLVGRV